jgi:predicted membrane protein (TIGR00267 family)
VLKNLREWYRNKTTSYKLYCKITGCIPVSRRYFIIGYFDGVLTIQGMILGAYLSGKSTTELIISAGIATALALGISSGWGAYEAEMVEQRALKKKKERALLKKVDGGIMERAHAFAIWISAVVHAISPIIAALITLSAFFFLPMRTAVFSSIGIGFLQLFIIGIFMGKISSVNILISGLRLLLAGVVTLILVTILNPSHIS